MGEKELTEFLKEQEKKEYRKSRSRRFIEAVNRRLTGYTRTGKHVIPKRRIYGGGYRRSPAQILRAQTIAGIGGQRIPSQGGYYQGKTGKIGRGRPRGPSGRYFIPGKGSVGVYEYRRWFTRQRALSRLQEEQRYSQMPIEQQRQMIEQQQIQQQTPQQVQVQQPQPQPQSGGLSLWGKPVFQAKSPIKNEGDYYTEPDFFSGKQMLKRRTRQWEMRLW